MGAPGAARRQGGFCGGLLADCASGRTWCRELAPVHLVVRSDLLLVDFSDGCRHCLALHDM